MHLVVSENILEEDMVQDLSGTLSFSGYDDNIKYVFHAYSMRYSSGSNTQSSMI